MFKESLPQNLETYYQSERACLLWGDAFGLLKKIKTESIAMIFADPPYFLSNGGITCQSGRMVSVDKASWDKLESFMELEEEKISGEKTGGKKTSRKKSDEETANRKKTGEEKANRNKAGGEKAGRNKTSGHFAEKHSFNRRWIRLCRRVLKPEGTIWISGTMHNIYSIGAALEQEGFKLINNITWQKTNPPPNISCRCFTHSTETILWAKKDERRAKHYFDYSKMKEQNGGKQMKDVWTGGLTRASEKKEGKHPTQKPEYLLERIVLASTRKGEIILDPFCGSGTTGVAALRHGRSFIGIDNVKEYLEISRRRLEKVQAEKIQAEKLQAGKTSASTSLH